MRTSVRSLRGQPIPSYPLPIRLHCFPIGWSRMIGIGGQFFRLRMLVSHASFLSWSLTLEETEAKMSDPRSLGHPRTFEFNTLAADMVEEADAATKEDRDEGN